MDKGLKRRLQEAIETARLTRSIHGPFRNEEVAADIASRNSELFEEVRDELALHGLAAMVGSATRRAIAVSNPRQSWLPLPQFEHIPQFIAAGRAWLDLQNATLEQYRECTAALEARIKSYQYARSSLQKAKRDKAALKEMRMLDRTLAPYFAGRTTMTIGLASELHREHLASPSVQRKIKGGKARQALHRKSIT